MTLNAGQTQVKVYVKNNVEKGKTWGYFKDADFKMWPLAKARKDAFFCDQHKEWFALGEFKPQRVDGMLLCFEFAEFYWWKIDDQYHLTPEPSKEKAALRLALEAACAVKA